MIRPSIRYFRLAVEIEAQIAAALLQDSFILVTSADAATPLVTSADAATPLACASASVTSS